MKNIDPKILSISFANKDLCTRCGTCIGVCPTFALSLDKRLFPKLDRKRCVECRLCAQTCPGGRINFRELTEITFGHRDKSISFDGHVRKTYVGYAIDNNLRSGGAGGGVITAILWDLLKHGDVDGCIVTRMNPQKPWIGEPFIARTYEDLLKSQGSKYTIIPTNSIFSTIRNLPGKFAYAALPCQVHGFRIAAEKNTKLKEKISVVVGLFCGGSLEPFVVPELLKMKGLTSNDIEDFQFRGGEWPGKTRAIHKNGEIINMHYSNYKDGAYNYLIGIYMAKRCQTCIDGSCEFSDLSVSDAWTKDKEGKYKFKSHSRLLVRTIRGLEVIENASQRGSLFVKNVSNDRSYRTHKIQTKRKGTNAPLRVARLNRKGVPIPLYDRYEPEVIAKERLVERVVSFFLWMGQYKILRYPIIKSLTSKYAIPLIRIRIFLKKRKYRKRKN